MTKRTFISKSGDQYEWEETPEVWRLWQHYINQNIRSSNSKFPILTNQLLGITSLCIWSLVIL
jgi:hypothetical protein